MKDTANKINLLFIIMQMEMGGSERLVYNLVHKLDRNIFNLSIAWFYGDMALKEFKDLNVPLFHVPKVKRIDLSAMGQIARIIRDNDVHIVNAHHFMSMIYAFYGCKMKNNIALIYTEHSEWELEKIPWKWAKIGRILLNRAEGVVGVNTAISKKMKNKFRINDDKVITIKNGVDLGIINMKNGENDLRNELGLAAHDRILGIVANLKKVKNHILLLKAFRELINDYQNVKLLLIGQGFKNDPDNSEVEIRNYIKENGLMNKVLMLGYRSDVQQLLRIMDVFCLVSHKEGLPISLVEAMAAGLPVVGTDVEGIRDVVLPGKNGFLVSTEDVHSLKKVLLTLLQDDLLRKTLGKESKSLAKINYSLDDCLEEYQKLFCRSRRENNDVYHHNTITTNM